VDVIITDHHLPGETLPEGAVAIVNPNLNGDEFPSKALAGCGVMFYLLMALRKKLQELEMNAPPLRELLDIVALGTVADLVPLDRNNRILVAAGLYQIRNGRAHAGIKALIDLVGKDPETLCAQDFGFSIAPRINAAGRLEDMTIGVETLLCDNYDKARELVARLDAINRERQTIQESMVAEAEALMEESRNDHLDDRLGVVVFEPHWHAGVVGLVASKLKESLHRPVFAFAPGEGDETALRGSGRSIEGYHLRDALALIETRRPGILPKFGGHAMAAGCSLDRDRLDEFSVLFDQVAREALTEDQLQACILTDGELSPEDISLELANWIQWAGPWGQAFPQPCFDNVFETLSWWRMAADHVKLRVRDPRSGKEYDAVHFRGYQEEAYPQFVRIAYELNSNTWYEQTNLQLMVKTIQPFEGTIHHGTA
jgi:single-stranded-DNA-specific exonuclease